MSTNAFILVIFSGFMHALYNLLIKRSGNKSVFIWWLFAVSTLLFTLMLPFLPGPLTLAPSAVALATGAAACFVLYHLCAARAYRSGDLSATYPLTQTAILYVPLWAFWFFGEAPSLSGWCGILLVAAGAYLTQVRRWNPQEMVRPFRNLLDHSVQSAIAAGFVYSVGSLMDAAGVRNYPPLIFTYTLIVAMLVLMTANLMLPSNRREILPEWRANNRIILAGGPLMVGSFLSFRYGLALSPLSYALPVRQSSILAGVAIGVLFLREPCGPIRLCAATLIFAGIWLIKLG